MLKASQGLVARLPPRPRFAHLKPHPMRFWPKRSERKGLWQVTYKPIRLKNRFSALESHEILTRLSCKLPLDNSGMLKVFPLQTIDKESQLVCANFLG